MIIKNIILHLFLIDGIGPSCIQLILNKIGSQRLFEIYDYSVKDFILFGISEVKAQLLVQGLASRVLLEQEMLLMKQYQVSFVSICCLEYPDLLKEIHVPPVILYYQGNVELLNNKKTLACVGSRKASRYVFDVLTLMIVPLILDGWVIISGGALGADTYAHQVTVAHGGKTIVVVGSGLCHVYPPQNKKLFHEIIQAGGVIVSSFSMNIKPEAHCFPIRNRIIAGLSRGCLVLQAAQKSGALITAECAINQGREVFAVPGSIFDPLSIGCHSLVQQGAKLVTSAYDILSEFVIDDHKHISLQGIREKKSVSIAEKALQKDDLNQQILHCLITPISVDLLMNKLSIDLSVLQNKLFDLSLEGLIEQDSMGFWKRL